MVVNADDGRRHIYGMPTAGFKYDVRTDDLLTGLSNGQTVCECSAADIPSDMFLPLSPVVSLHRIPCGTTSPTVRLYP